MLRTAACALAGLLVLCVGLASAAEVKGKIKSVDKANNIITVTVGNKDVQIAVDEKAPVIGVSGKELKDAIKNRAVAAGAEVTLITTKRGTKDVCTKITITKNVER